MKAQNYLFKSPETMCMTCNPFLLIIYYMEPESKFVLILLTFLIRLTRYIVYTKYYLPILFSGINSALMESSFEQIYAVSDLSHFMKPP